MVTTGALRTDRGDIRRLDSDPLITIGDTIGISPVIGIPPERELALRRGRRLSYGGGKR
jgi:hypothetical protein